MSVRWDEEEALDQTACLLAECGERGKSCWALQVVLDEVIQSVGPWWLAHFIATTPNRPAADALEEYLKAKWPAHAERVAQMIEATNWTEETNHLARELGED